MHAMPNDALDHVTLRCSDPARTLAFYDALLGLRPGPRPPFRVGGQWLYAGGQPVLHLLAPSPRAGFDHVAFAAEDRRAHVARLVAAAIPFRLQPLPDGSALQLFVHDPDGVRVELVFRRPEDLLP